MQYFFTADTHFFHRNILKYCDRNYPDQFAMNRDIIRRWNSQVGKHDRVYHLGDVSFGGLAETFRLLAELNGEICLVIGNHDDELIKDPYLCERFLWMKHYHEERIGSHDVVMCHYPIAQWRDAQRGSWHLHGHTHGSIQMPGAALDVGIDNHPEFRLWRWEEIERHLCHVKPLAYPVKISRR